MLILALSGLFLLTGQTASSSCPLKIDPPSVLVKFGDSMSVNCTSTTTRSTTMGWESPQGGTEPEEVSSVQLKINKVENLSMFPKCFINLLDPPFQCQVDLNVTVYKPPENVTISNAYDLGSVVEGDRKVINCSVAGVAPLRNLQVSWYKGDQVVFPEAYDKATARGLVVATSSYVWIARKEDDGLSVRCEAKLKFGSKTLVATKSKPERLSVSYPPHFAKTEERITLKNNEGVILNCTVPANPAAKYAWQLAPNAPPQKDADDLQQPVLNVSFPMPGAYTCRASNPLGNTSKSFILEQKSRDNTIVGAVIGAFVVLGLVLAIGGYFAQKPDGTFCKGDYKAAQTE